MNDTRVQSFVSAVHSNRTSDATLIQLAAELFELPRALEQVREAWSSSDFPIIAEYLCSEVLGHGSSGVVYKALRFTTSPEWVALKVLRHVTHRGMVRFVQREVEILKALDCPNVARYLDSGHAGGSNYLAMELVEGVPLDEYLRNNDLTLEQKLELFERVCDVIADVHAQGVMHRDLTPRHLLVDEHGQPRLVDFGLSAVQSEEWATHVRETQTQLGSIMGTVKYMSPEQAWGGMMPVDQSTDLWALGIMLFEIATDGDYPYSLETIEGKSAPDSILHRIQNEVPKKPQIPDAQYAHGLTTLISRCLASEPRRRIESARQLRIDIANLRQRSVIRTKPLPRLYRLQRIAIGMMLRSRTAVRLLIVAGVVFGMTAGSLLFGIDFGFIEDDHSVAARTELIKADALYGPLDFVLVGVGDDSATRVMAYAQSNGIANVTQDNRTWREVHGQLMTKLAVAKPRAVVWDFFFRSARPNDAAMVEGIKALDNAGVPVALAVKRYLPDGTPDLSPNIYEPLREVVHHGLILALDMVNRPGEFVIALQRGDQTLPSLALVTLSALCHPNLQSEASWKPGNETVTVQHRARNSLDYIKGIDRIHVQTLSKVSDGRLQTEVGDVPATKTFDLTPLSVQQARTVSYERMLDRSDAQLTQLVGGKIVLFIDLRTGGSWFARAADRHPVKYATGVVDNVPGGYLLADAINGLTASVSVNRRHWLPLQAYTLIVAMAVVGCLLASLISRPQRARSTRAQTITVGTLAVITITCGLATFDPLSRTFVDWVIGGAAAGSALVLALLVEYVRNRYRFPRASDTPSHLLDSR